jgi:ssDNA-binding replication factor A large subunit
MQTIKSLTGGLKKVSVQGKIVWKGDIRTGSKNGTDYRVVSALLRDSTESIQLSLFGDLADIAVGTEISISNGYTTEFAGKPQLNVGRFGKLSIVAAPTKATKLS